MDLMLNIPSMVTLLLQIVFCYVFAKRSHLDYASLSSFTFVVSLTYFYVMPLLAFSGGDRYFLGTTIDSLKYPHYAVMLYSLGACVAFAVFHRTLSARISFEPRAKYSFDPRRFNLLVAGCAGVVVIQFLTGRMNFFGSQAFVFNEAENSLKFLNLFFTTMISLTLVYLIRNKFNVKSLVVLTLVLLIFLVVGFRYRIVMLIFGACLSFVILNNIRVRASYLLGSIFFGLLLVNFLGKTRVRGVGVDFSRVDGFSIGQLLSSFGGEIGPVFTLYNLTDPRRILDLVYFEPWLVGVSRLVPTFLWPNKPAATYLDQYHGSYSSKVAEMAGIAAPQHVEILLQFGWGGLAIVSFIYFSLACVLQKKMVSMRDDLKVAGLSVIPIFFGFYMQTRGYFFQIFTDAIFLFGPLFFIQRSKRLRSNMYGRRSRRS